MSPCERPIFIVTSGRSGSTMLQKLLNSHPNLIIWGEHAGILNFITNSWEAVRQQRWIGESMPNGLAFLDKNAEISEEKWTAWASPFSKEIYERRLRLLLDDLFGFYVPKDTRWGFKEIRYKRLVVLEFLRAMYPQCQFIFLIRDLLDTCVSMALGWAEVDKIADDDKKLQKVLEGIFESRIRPFTGFLEQALERYEDTSVLVTYEDIVASPADQLRALARFLEIEPGFDWDQVDRIMNADIVSIRKRFPEEILDNVRSVSAKLVEKDREQQQSIAEKWRLLRSGG